MKALNIIQKYKNINNFFINEQGELFEKVDGEYIKKETSFSERRGEFIYLNRIREPIHRIMAEIYIKDYKGERIRHVDGNKHNNHISNLIISSGKNKVIRDQKEWEGFVPPDGEEKISSIAEYKDLFGYTFDNKGNVFSYRNGYRQKMKTFKNAEGIPVVRIGSRQTTIKTVRLKTLMVKLFMNDADTNKVIFLNSNESDIRLNNMVVLTDKEYEAFIIEKWENMEVPDDEFKINHIKGYEGCPFYTVSKNGDVFSYKGKAKISLKKNKNTQGYYGASFSKIDGEKQTFRFHKMVALAFIPNPKNYPQINHIDFNKRNNIYTNLEWCTNEYNAKHAKYHRKVQRLSKQKKTL
ncbi:HNH endonuclease [Peptoniphilus sp. GNH]|nr:HNH endonuclease [Peptoniphilus sp. GNH]